MPQLVLYYFTIRGRADIIRCLLTDGGVAFTEERIPKAEWPQHKSEFVFGQMPVLRIDGTELAQSHAIARYAASISNPSLLGNGPLESAMVTMWYHQAEDVYSSAVHPFYMKSREEVEQLYEQNWSRWMAPFEKVLSSPDTHYLANNQLSLADYHLFDVCELCAKFKPHLLAATPTVKAHWERMCSRPGVAKFRESVKELNFTNTDKI